MKAYFYIKTIKTWISIRQIVSVFSDGKGWTVKLTDGSKYPMTQEEYDALSADLEESNKAMREHDRRRDDEGGHGRGHGRDDKDDRKEE